ncbi:MAG: hypothetical protein IT249_07375 [Chitinophagaceae bacterium]|nr:hypothetical protein [Chitinophagaceae bacterium]
MDVFYDQHLLTYFTGVGVYSAIRQYANRLSNEQQLIYVFLLLLAIEIGFLIIEGFYLLSMQTFSLQAFRGSFDNSGKLGYYIAILYPCALFVIIESGKKSFIVKTGLWIGFIILMLFLILSFSRIAWFSAFVSSTFMVKAYLQNKKQRLFFYMLTFLVAIALIAVILFIKKDSVSGRILIWNITSSHLDEYWLEGAGYGKFASVYNLWQSDYFSIREIIDKRFYIADNTYFALMNFYKRL